MAPQTWGEHVVAVDVPMEVAIGTLRANIQRSTMEWIVQYRYEQDRYVRESAQATTRLRFVFQHTKECLLLRPATADRNVVARPTEPIHLPPHERATLYVSSLLWLQVTVRETAVLLADLPVQIMSDSWFGANTREGELCYSNETPATIRSPLIG